MAKIKDPGTRFPFISLDKAIDRGRQLFDADPQGRPMPVPTAFSVWGYSDKSSGGHQTVAALKMYGIMADEGANESRRVMLTPQARAYFLDEREDERLKLLRGFALHPGLIAAVWKDWGAAPPADNVARSYLKLDRKLNEQSARSFLGIYKENLAFAEIKGSDEIPESDHGEDHEEERAEDNGLAGVKNPPPPPPPPPAGGKIKVLESERVVFVEEGAPSQYVKLVASGELDEYLLEALDDYVKRQKKRLKRDEPSQH